MDDGNISFQKITPEIEKRIINGKLINPDELDESFPFGVSEFLRLPQLN